LAPQPCFVPHSFLSFVSLLHAAAGSSQIRNPRQAVASKWCRAGVSARITTGSTWARGIRRKLHRRGAQGAARAPRCSSRRREHGLGDQRWGRRSGGRRRGSGTLVCGSRRHALSPIHCIFH
jgi:hypothetical protein